MPTSRVASATAGTDPWRHNERLIRKLYQDERKTLEQVKLIMETEYNFPQIPLSTWETKLRDVLGLRKKMKMKDWPIIYSHVRPRLEQKKETAIYLNGTRMEWKRAWKEMRRNRTTSQPAQQEQLHPAPLPPGVVVRTPSPAQLMPTNNAPLQSNHSDTQSGFVFSSCYDLETQCSSTLAKSTRLERHQSNPTSLPAYQAEADRVYRLCLETIPFVLLARYLARTGTNTISALDGQWPAIFSPNHQLHDLRLHSSTVDSSGGLALAASLSHLALECSPALRRTLSLEISTNFDVQHYIAMAVYTLSNDLYASHNGSISYIIEFLFDRVPRTSLVAFFRSGSSSMRAAWERLIDHVFRRICHNKHLNKHLNKPLITLIEIGFDHDWMDDRIGSDCFYAVVHMDCADIVQKFLAQGYVSVRVHLNDDFSINYPYTSTIVAALDNKNLECARLLIQHCNVSNVPLHENGVHISSADNFSILIGRFRNEDEVYNEALEMFLSYDPDVDAPFFRPFGNQYEYQCDWDRFCNENDILKERHISVLDYCFYFNRPLFKRLRSYSKAWPSRMTRAGILGALELGLHSLRGYLQRVCHDDTDAKERYLEFILAEQFLKMCCYPRGGYVAMDPHVTLALLELDVDPTLPLIKNPPDAGCCAIRQIHVAENSDTRRLWMSVLELLLLSGATLGSEALVIAVDNHDISLLQYLISCTANLAEEGREALAWAASRNDFEAVDLLLQAGVDINCYVQGAKQSLTILAYAISDHMTCRVSDQTASYEMMKYLIENGAVPKALPDDWHPCHFLQFLLRYTEAGFEIVQKVQYIVETFDIDFGDPSTPSDGLLEACLWGTLDFSDDDSRERLATFEYLLQKFPVCIGASLAPLIMRGGRQQLIQDLISAGADIRTYSFSGTNYFYIDMGCMSPLQAAAWRGDEQLVQQLLDLGVEVDGKPLPGNAATALECICKWKPLTSEEGLRRLRIIQTLLNHGAEVNASGSNASGINAYRGGTALHEAVRQGALDVTTLLLCHGANASVTTDDGDSALDIAADWGCIDIAQFLLNANAVSGRPGKTGYDGAIQRARERGHFALADVIVKHAESNLRLGIVVPFLSS